jgi:hypothetical protein
VSYYVINGGSSRSPKLQALVERIKVVEQLLGCHLEVVHVPGKMMIIQGTDGLSRGLWLAPERRPYGLNQEVFLPLPFNQGIGQWACDQLGWNPHYHHIDADSSWDPRSFRGRLTIWNPSAEWARQALSVFIRSWIQSPWDTAAIFLIPRILQRRWGRVCRYIKELGVFHGNLLPEYCSFEAHLPFVFLYIPCHISVLGKSRLGETSIGDCPNWHKRQADDVRGLL